MMEAKCERVTVQSGEDQSSVASRFSLDGRWLFVCSGSTVRVYSTVSHELTHILSRHEATITSCSVNPTNSLQLLTASLDGKVMIWDYLDGSFLRDVEFGVPLFDFAVRPGKKEPKVFFQIERGTMEVDSSEGIELGCTESADKVVVGLPSEVILCRDQSESPAIQLSRATEYLHLGSTTPSKMCFSFNGEFVMSYFKKSLLVCHISKNRQRSFQTSYVIGAIASHPTEPCVATGNERGEVQLWWGWNHRSKQPLTSVLHWHAHAVADLCFTSDGTYLLSGGEECVLVVWQLALNQKHFRPRLGAQITRVSCAPADQSFAVSLQNNIIQVVSGLNNNVEWTVGGLRRAHTQDPRDSGMRTGLVWDPRSCSIVANGNPGSLQWYRPDVDQVASQLDVTGLNYVSRRDDPLVLMTVEHAALSSDGHWLATVEWRDDGKTTPELRLKFWLFNTISQEFELNTCVEPPHNRKVTSLSFQPPPPRPSSTKQSKGSTPPLMAVTTSEDGKFKSWVMVGGGEGSEGASWACRSVGHYQSLPCRSACFSRDGSLLVTNFEKCLTLWNPYTCNLRRVFSSPFPPEKYTWHTFGGSRSSHYLLSTTDHHLIVWDLLKCAVLWSVTVDVTALVADPTSSMAAAFVPSKQGTTHLYSFEPSSPTPVSVLESVCSGAVTSAMYSHTTSIAGSGKWRRASSTLYFQTASQVLYRVLNEGDDPLISGAKCGSMVAEKEMEEKARQSFFEVFGAAEKGEVETKTSVSVNENVKVKPRLKMLDAAPHALPPLTSIAQLFLHSLLPTLRLASSKGEMKDSDSEEEEEEGERESHKDSDLGERDVKTTASVVPVSMETDDLLTLPVDFKVPNFDWLTPKHFRPSKQ